MRSPVEDFEVPDDAWAEEETAGVVVASPAGAVAAARWVVPADFYRPRLGRVFAAAQLLADLPDPGFLGRARRSYELGGPVLRSERIRAGAVAVLADVPVDEVVALVESRSLVTDPKGRFARRVADASRRRRAMRALANAFNLLGQGAALEEAWCHLAEVGP